MNLFDRLLSRSGRAKGAKLTPPPFTRLEVEPLEARTLLDASGILAAGTLTITSMAVPFERIGLFRDAAANQLVLTNFGAETQRFDNAAVANIVITLQGNDVQLIVADNVLQAATIQGSNGKDLIQTGSGTTNVLIGTGITRVVTGTGSNFIDAHLGVNSISTERASSAMIVSGGFNRFYGARDHTTILGFDPARDQDYRCVVTPPDLSSTLGLPPSPCVTISAQDVRTLLDRASAATPSTDGIIAIVDRGGRILGVRAEAGVDPAILGNPEKLAFAVDGAVALARTGAFFGNNQAPLTSRTIQDISQTTMTQREIESDPNSADPTVQGPGFVAPVGIKGHFPPGVPFTNQVDLFAIEHTNRDTTSHPNDGNPPVALTQRFNIDSAFIPATIPVQQQLAAPDSYGFASNTFVTGNPRGIATLPGGIPIYGKDPTTGQFTVVVGGIGVFFPGKTGFATEENSSLSATFDPTKPDRTLEAEFDALAALGGAPTLGSQFAVGTLAGIPAPTNVGFFPVTQDSRIDLVGISLDIIGPGGTQGPINLINYVNSDLHPGTGDISGMILPLLDPGADNKLNPPAAPGYIPNPALPIDNVVLPVNQDTTTYPVPPMPPGTLPGTCVPEGFLVTPHDSAFPGGLTAADVERMIEQGVAQALQTRAAIRLPTDQNVKMVFAVADLDGSILGLFRMPDSTVFSIDVAVAKARNVAYYADPTKLQPIDQVPGVPAGTAFTNRTFRYLALPRFPEGIDGRPPGPFSILNDGGVDPNTGLNVGPPLPVSAYQSVQGFDAFNPQTNFRDPFNLLNQNGIVFFPGSVPLYKNTLLVGGVGISGDGVDQDDVVTFATKQGFDTPANVLRADEVFVRGVRLPYQKFNRQPQNF